MARKKKTEVQAQPEWLSLFLGFISVLSIDSKESGVGPLMLYGSQKRYLAELIDGLNRDIHTFVCLKARQLGISTVALAVDLFWLIVHPGMQGAIVTDTDGNRDKFRIILTRMLASLPAGYRVEVKLHNRSNLVLGNGSTLDYLVAGTRKTATKVGISRAYNFLHGTEISNFGAIEGIQSLFATLAQKHPDRMYIFESTARGFNLFYTLWQQARSDPLTQKAMFIGWWANEQYALDENSDLFKRYWDGMVEVEEQERINNVWAKYGVRITPQQIAWYRWMEETQSGSTGLMDQDYPWDEDDAFLQTGVTFFPIKKMVSIIKGITSSPVPFLGYAYEFGENFMDTKVHSVDDADEAELKVYEEPSEIGQYVIGVDPAYGDSDNADNSAIEVYRCYADKLVQVAEFASANPINVQVAWVLAHLAGLYKNVMMIIELTGPGEATVLELKHLRQLFDAGALPIPGDGGMEDIFGNARWFMYHRSDSPGAGYVFNWKANQDSTTTNYTQAKDLIVLDMLVINSIQCALEFQGIVQEGGSFEPAVTTGKKDRVSATTYAVRAWTDWVRPGMIGNNETFERVTKAEVALQDGSHTTMVSHVVADFFAGKQQDREDEEIERMWRE